MTQTSGVVGGMVIVKNILKLINEDRATCSVVASSNQFKKFISNSN